jgi:hypothetical protein
VVVYNSLTQDQKRPLEVKKMTDVDPSEVLAQIAGEAAQVKNSIPTSYTDPTLPEHNF